MLGVIIASVAIHFVIIALKMLRIGRKCFNSVANASQMLRD